MLSKCALGLAICGLLITAACAQQTDEEWVSKREFEILKEEFAGVKSELEKINKDIQSLKRGDKFGQLLLATTTDVFTSWNLGKVHNAGITGKGTVIAILDCGINLDHGSIKEKYDRNEISGDKSSKVTTTNHSRPAYHCNKAEHGTAVAAVAAGDDVYDETGGKVLIRRGVAPGAELYVYRLSDDFDYNEVRDALGDVLQHISKAKKKIDIICMSFGFTGNNDEIEKLLSELAEKGVVCVAPAGNDGNFQEMVKFPASSDHVLSVGALTKTGQSSNLNPNDNIDVFAIGENVIVPTSLKGKIQRSAQGTSYAAPMVAGLLSLLMQYARAVPHRRDDIESRLHSVDFLRGFFKDYKLCDNRKLVHVDGYFEDLLDYKAKVPSSPLEKCVEKMYPEKLYYEDALWDGKGCGPTSSCCQFNSPPYFWKALPQATTDDIEVRLCEYFVGGGYNEDTPIEAIELFVQ